MGWRTDLHLGDTRRFIAPYLPYLSDTAGVKRIYGLPGPPYRAAFPGRSGGASRHAPCIFRGACNRHHYTRAIAAVSLLDVSRRTES